MKRHWRRMAEAIDDLIFDAVAYATGRPVDEPIDLWPVDVDDLVDPIAQGRQLWDAAPLRPDAAIVRAARCVDLEAAAGRLSQDDVVRLYDAIATAAGTWAGEWHTIVDGRR